jgi:hypothetical protein
MHAIHEIVALLRQEEFLAVAVAVHELSGCRRRLASTPVSVVQQQNNYNNYNNSDGRTR